MELTVSSYMSPWTSSDYSLSFAIQLCGRWKTGMLRSDAPVDLTQFASDLAKFNINSSDTILDLSSVPDNVLVLEVRVSPYPEGELAIVAVQSMQVEGQGELVVESSIRELVPIHRINTIGKGLLVAASGKSEFEFNSSADLALTAT
jgi:hypothetical protein